MGYRWSSSNNYGVADEQWWQYLMVLAIEVWILGVLDVSISNLGEIENSRWSYRFRG